jgi:hypothetical protein
MPSLGADSIPLCVVHLALLTPTLELIKGLLATRHKRELQSLHFYLRVTDNKVAAVAAELVCTDPHKQWTYRSSFSRSAGSAFCAAAISAQTASHSSSLTAFHVSSSFRDVEWSSLLLSSTLTSFRVHIFDVTAFPLPALRPPFVTVAFCFFRVYLRTLKSK